MLDARDLPVDEQGRPLLNWPPPGTVIRVGVADLTRVSEHRIAQCFNSVSHHIRLTNGGLIQFAYELDGHVLELSAERVKIVAQENGTIVFDTLETVPAADG
ncbi:MAG: hypothetical protein QM739_13940 [Propionivibrio sp.]